MDKALLREFITQLNTFDGKDYLLSIIAYGAAPTIKGMKPSSLISFSKKGRNLFDLWEKYKNEIYMDLNVNFFELKETEEQRLVLFYNIDMLERHISSKDNRAFLKDMGYHGHKGLIQALELLKLRFEHVCPHEIGIFLGIPVEDVSEFIRHKGDKCLFCSYWKVYHNLEQAKTLFKRYDMAKINVIYSIMNLNLYKNVTA